MTPNISIHPLEMRRILKNAIKQVEFWRKELQSPSLMKGRKPKDWDKLTSKDYLRKLHQMYAHLGGKLHTRRRNLPWNLLNNRNLQKQAILNGGTLTIDYDLDMQFADIPPKMWKEVVIQFREF